MSEQTQTWTPKTLFDRILCRELGIVTQGMAKQASETPISPLLIHAGLRINAVKSAYQMKKTAGVRLLAGLVTGDELMVKVAALGLQMKQAREEKEAAAKAKPAETPSK